MITQGPIEKGREKQAQNIQDGFLNSARKERTLVTIYLVSGVFNVTMNYIFIPAYSFYMSAVITHLSELLILILLIITVRKIWRKTYAA